MPDFSCITILHLAIATACFLLSSYHTSICSIKLNAKVSIRSTGVVAGSENDASDGFAFPDHTGDGWRGHYPVVSNDQTTHLGESHIGVFYYISAWGRGGNSSKYQVCQFLSEVNRIFYFTNGTCSTPRASSIMCKWILNPSNYIIYPFTQLADKFGSNLEHLCRPYVFQTPDVCCV